MNFAMRAHLRFLTTGFRRRDFQHFFPVSNYPFLTPQKKDSEFRIPLSEWFRRDAKWRRQNRVVGMTPRGRKSQASESPSLGTLTKS
jgi:hypothetical protein